MTVKVKIVICYCSGSDLFQTVKIFCYMQGLGKFIRRMIGVSFCWCFRLDIDAFPDLEKGGPIESFGSFFFFFFPCFFFFFFSPVFFLFFLPCFFSFLLLVTY